MRCARRASRAFAATSSSTTRFFVAARRSGEFDGRPNRSYNVLPDALMVNFQSIEFRVAANADTRRVDIVASPSPGNLIIDNEVRFFPGRCGAAAAGWIPGRLRALGQGGIQRSAVASVRGAQFCARAAAAGHLRVRHFRRALHELGESSRASCASKRLRRKPSCSSPSIH